MSPFPYDVLWHYSEKFSRDPDLRQDLVLMAYQQDLRFGDKSEIRLLKHYMKLRAKEVHKRNSLGKSVGGKSKKDIYRCERLSIHKPLPEGSLWPIAETLSCVAYDPLSTTIVNQFSDSLPELEGRVAEQMISGYTRRESLAHLGITQKEYLQWCDEGLPSEAIALFDQNISRYPNSELERDGLYGSFLNALYTDEDTSSARTWLSTLSVRYSESDEALVADHLLETYIATMSSAGAEGQQIGRGSTPNSVIALPEDFRLAQNFPNPFNPSPTIRYALPEDAKVSLKVYDVLGREILTLVNGSQEVGYHQLSLDATNLASGMYFYRLTPGSFTDVKKLVVLK